MSTLSGVGTTNTNTGLGQGIDVQALVTASLAGDQANITQLQKRQSAFTSQAAALQQIATEITNLRSAAFSLKDPLGSLNALTATSSNANVLSATAASTAVAGTHTITVTSLATTSSFYSDAVATSSTPLAVGGSFSISVGGKPAVPFTLDSTNNTLDGLAAFINNSPQNPGVSASVINDANGARLALVSNTTGAPGNLTVTGHLNLTDTNNTQVNSNSAVVGVNAVLTVDGVPISSTTNTVTGVLNGVTLNLTAPAPNSPVTLTLSPDTTKASDAVNQFVAAYNTVINDINKQFAVNSNGTGGGPLEADGSVREAQSALLQAAAYSISGNNGFVNLSTIGVNLNNDGTLGVDSAKLSSALSGHSADVKNLLQASSNGFAGNLASTLTALTDPGSGALGLDSRGINQSSQDLSLQISDLQAALRIKEQGLILIYSRVNQTLQLLPLLQAQLSQQLATVR